MEKLFNIKEAATLTSMSEVFFRKAILDKRIEYVKVGNAVRIAESALVDFVKVVPAKVA